MKSHDRIAVRVIANALPVSVFAEVMDRINHRYGRNTLFLAGEGIERKWNMRRNFLSRRFTTNWNELPEVK